MKYCLLQVGKTRERALCELISTYEKRLQSYVRFETITIPATRAKSLTQALVKREEGRLIRDRIKPSDWLVLLDPEGRSFTSVGLSEQIAAHGLRSLRRVVIAIGGAYGFSEQVYERANERWSLSKLTFSHQLVRLFFVEQLYRAFTILHHEPYHHGDS